MPDHTQEEMPGVKRQHDGAPKTQDKEMSSSPFMPMFEVFRNELDEHHDRRERIIKASRDITAASKKIIFALQRVKELKVPIPTKIEAETKEKYKIMATQFEAITPDLQGINAWRYQRQISGGIQEFMEAVSFEFYLRNQRLLTIAEASKSLPDSIELTEDDYVLGIFDLVGELMRFAITTMATTGKLPGGERDILMDLRELRTAFETLDTTSDDSGGLAKNIPKKLQVMKECVGKVEMAVYGMIIRGRERPKGWVPDLSTEERPPVESY